jgi:hypothetical protein
MALLPRRFRCSGRGRPCAPGRLATGDLGSCDCRQRYPARGSVGTSHLPPVPSSLSVVRLRVSVDEGSPRCRRFCGVDRLQITCHRRSKNPSAVTAKTPKNGLEITAAVCASLQPMADHAERGRLSQRQRAADYSLSSRCGASWPGRFQMTRSVVPLDQLRAGQRRYRGGRHYRLPCSGQQRRAVGPWRTPDASARSARGLPGGAAGSRVLPLLALGRAALLPAGCLHP